jgi:hypothetical protein
MSTTESTTIHMSWFARHRLALRLLGLGLFALAMIGLAFYSVVRFKRKANQEVSKQNLKQLADALHRYDDEHKRLPDHAIVDQKTGEPLLSWRVALLPFLGENELYDKIRLDEPWDSKHNRQFWDRMPSVYQLPGKPNDGTTYYQVFHGDGALFCKVEKHADGWRGTKYTIDRIPDGSSNTVFAVEAANPVNWMKPQDIPFKESKDGVSLDVLGDHWGDGTWQVVTCDAVVRSPGRSVSPTTLQWAIMPNDGLGAEPRRGCN